MSSGSGRRSCWPAQNCLCGGFFRGAFSFRCGFGVSYSLQMPLYLFGDICRNGARVGLLLGYAKPRQEINDGFRLDLQLAREFIDANLGCVAHAS